MQRFNFIIKWGIVFLSGFLLGAYLFAGTQPRAFVSVENCGSGCLSTSELAGLLASIGLRKTPGFVPHVVKETDRVVAIESPTPHARINYVIFPKKDIKDLGDLSVEDSTYLSETIAVMSDLVREQGLTNYRIMTNGPGWQQINYLHFHLLED